MHVGLLFAFVSWTGQTGVGSFLIPSTSMALVVLVGILPGWYTFVWMERNGEL